MILEDKKLEDKKNQRFLNLQTSGKLEDKENYLFNRREVKFIVKAEKNPSYEEASQIIADNFKAASEMIVIKQVKGKFGRNTFLISAFIYKTKENKEEFEPKPKKKEEKEEEKPAAEKKPVEEKKIEEKPEGKVKEEKKEDLKNNSNSE